MDTDWRSYREPVLGSSQYLAQGLLWGALGGFVFAGIGGRLAMLVLRLTSDPALAGMETDDGFTIGAITSDTLFLFVLGTVAGAMGGGAYALVRVWIPRRLRLAIAGVFGAVAIGALTIEPGGIDFTELEPLALAVTMFIALPAAYAVATSWLIERAYAREFRVPGALALAVTLLPFLAQGPTGLIAIAVALVLMAGNREGVVSGLWRSSAVAWLGRGALAAVFVLSSQALYRDVTEVL